MKVTLRCLTSSWLLVVLASPMVFPAAVASAKSPDNCTWGFAAKVRKQVKLRKDADGTNYGTLNNGNPVTVDQWLERLFIHPPGSRHGAAPASQPGP